MPFRDTESLVVTISWGLSGFTLSSNHWSIVAIFLLTIACVRYVILQLNYQCHIRNLEETDRKYEYWEEVDLILGIWRTSCAIQENEQQSYLFLFSVCDLIVKSTCARVVLLSIACNWDKQRLQMNELSRYKYDRHCEDFFSFLNRG